MRRLLLPIILFAATSASALDVNLCTNLKELKVANKVLEINGCLEIENDKASKANICVELSKLNIDEASLSLQGCVGNQNDFKFPLNFRKSNMNICTIGSGMNDEFVTYFNGNPTKGDIKKLIGMVESNQCRIDIPNHCEIVVQNRDALAPENYDLILSGSTKYLTAEIYANGVQISFQSSCYDFWFKYGVGQSRNSSYCVEDPVGKTNKMMRRLVALGICLR